MSGEGNYRTYARTLSAIANYVRKWKKETVRGYAEKRIGKKISDRRIKEIIQENIELSEENAKLFRSKERRDRRIAKLKEDKEELLVQLCELKHGVSIKNPAVHILNIHPPPEDYPTDADNNEETEAKEDTPEGGIIQADNDNDSASNSKEDLNRTKEASASKSEKNRLPTKEQVAMPNNNSNSDTEAKIEKPKSSANGGKKKQKLKRTKEDRNEMPGDCSAQYDTNEDALVDTSFPADDPRTIQKQFSSPHSSTTTGKRKKSSSESVNVTTKNEDSDEDIEHTGSDNKTKHIKKPRTYKKEILKVKLPTNPKKRSKHHPSSSNEDIIDNNSNKVGEKNLMPSTKPVPDSPNLTLDDEDFSMVDVAASIDVVDEVLRLEEEFEHKQRSLQNDTETIVTAIIDDLIGDITAEVLMDFSEDINSDNDESDLLELELDSDDEFFKSTTEEAKLEHSKANEETISMFSQESSFSSTFTTKVKIPTKQSSKYATKNISASFSPKKMKSSLHTYKGGAGVSKLPSRSPSSRSQTITMRKHFQNKVTERNVKKKATELAKKAAEDASNKQIKIPSLPKISFQIPKKTKNINNESENLTASSASSSEINLNNNE